MIAPTQIQLVGDQIAIVWGDGRETYFTAAELRAASPSAETQGERDVFGRQYGGAGPKQFPGVAIDSWAQVGNYAVRFEFSDGHRTGLYSYDYLRQLAERQ